MAMADSPHSQSVLYIHRHEWVHYYKCLRSAQLLPNRLWVGNLFPDQPSRVGLLVDILADESESAKKRDTHPVYVDSSIGQGPSLRNQIYEETAQFYWR